MQKMFYPESVAVVGASGSPENMGRNIVQNLLTWEFTGRVYPVNPRGESVLGLEGYRSVEEIPGEVDLVVAFVPAVAVPGVVEQSARKGVTCMVIPSGGFAEYGRGGDELTCRVKEVAGRYGVRFIGPNCLAIINAENGLCLPFTTMQKRRLGDVSVISQSGGVGLSLIMFLDNASRGINKFISVGNKVDMDELDFLEYLGRDPGTKVICMFLESVSRGKRFLETASKLTKPVLVYKANTTEAGARTARSHTAALFNNDAVLDGMFRQAGIFRVDAIQRLIYMALAFELPPMRGNNVAIISQAGGYTVLTADEASRRGFNIPPFSEDMLGEFKGHTRADVIRLGNPLDLGDIHSSDAVVSAIDDVMAQDSVDGVVAVLLRRADSKYDGAYSRLKREIYGDIGRIIKKRRKPLALALLTQCHYLRHVQSRMDYPIFESPEDAVEALAILRDYHRRNPAP